MGQPSDGRACGNLKKVLLSNKQILETRFLIVKAPEVPLPWRRQQKINGRPRHMLKTMRMHYCRSTAINKRKPMSSTSRWRCCSQSKQGLTSYKNRKTRKACRNCKYIQPWVKRAVELKKSNHLARTCMSDQRCSIKLARYEDTDCDWFQFGEILQTEMIDRKQQLKLYVMLLTKNKQNIVTQALLDTRATNSVKGLFKSFKLCAAPQISYCLFIKM